MKKKLNVAVKIVGLAIPSNGGIRTDIIDILDVYERKFGFYGFESDSKVTGNGKQINIPTDYDLSGTFGLISSKDQETLDAVY